MVIHLFMSFTFSYAFCSSVGPVVNGRARRSGSCLLASAEAVLPGLDGLSDEEARAARWLASDEMGQAHVLAAFDARRTIPLNMRLIASRLGTAGGATKPRPCTTTSAGCSHVPDV